LLFFTLISQINLNPESPPDSLIRPRFAAASAFGAAMPDGKKYYAAFPDEKPELRLRLRGLLNTLTSLEKEFRQEIEQFRAEMSDPEGRDKS